MLNTFKHLLPRARAFNITDPTKKLYGFFAALADSSDEIRQEIDATYLDLRPQTTRQIAEWESHFGIVDSGLDDQTRRDRLAAAWKEQGAQGPEYLQDVLQSNGFDVYIHEWYEPGSVPPVGTNAQATARNPFDYLRSASTGKDLRVECGMAIAACGEEKAACGEGFTPRGYPLVNKIRRTEPDFFVLAGQPAAACGEPSAVCGNFTDFIDSEISYTIPESSEYWPYILYIGGETFGELASVESSRREEFENLCLRICPAQQWLGILVEYV